MNLKDIEPFTFKYGRKIKLVKKIGLKIKLKQATRHWMSKKDVAAVENAPSRMSEILEKYKSSEKDYVASLKKKITSYSKKANIKIDAETEKDILFSSLAYGFMPDEYYIYELKDKTFEERKAYISERERIILFYNVNDIVNMQYARNKQLTYQFYKEFYKRDALEVKSANDIDAFLAFVDKYPVFVQKNDRKNCGQGVKLVNINDTGCSKEEYFKKLIADDEYLLEEPIKQAVLSEFNESSVNTVRCRTYINNGKVTIKHCNIRTGRNGAFIDNGAAGGVMAGIDPETGIIDTDAMTEFGEIFTEHPETHKVYKGYQMPDWEGLRKTATELALKLPDVRCVGWDLAYTEKGWCLVEANGRSQFIGPQLLYKKGIKSEILDALGEKGLFD